MKKRIIDYGSVSIVDEDLVYTRQTNQDEDRGKIAFRVKTEAENNCVIEETDTIPIADIKVKEGGTYSNDIELPILAGIDKKALRLEFRIIDHNGSGKSVLYSIYEEPEL